MTREELGKLIDHTLLKPEATRRAIEQLCREALDHHFAAVCVNPSRVAEAAPLLAGSGIGLAAVVGFPLGSTPAAVKVYEARTVLDLGATEIDLVINIGALKDGDERLVGREIEQVVNVARQHSTNVLVKVILETGLLYRDEKINGCILARTAGADFVKTSTGMLGSGATVEDVKLLKEQAWPLQVKASGGIRTWEQAVAMVQAGATRIGTSSGIVILNGMGDGEL